PFWILFGVACFSMAYVLIKGVALGGLNRSDPLILVFYQFSDLFIPVLLYSVAKKRFSKFNLIFISLFTTYAISVGFRYKLVLLYFPLILLLLGENVGALKKLKRRTYAVVTGCAVLVLFSLMTLTRKKFSGLDFSALEGVSLNLILYGLFAESNIIFGLLGILSEFLNKSNFIYLQPIIDSVLELVPRFFLPDRITGAYLVTGAAGLVTDQAMKSGTAYPYFGEFLSMGGHAAGVIGVIVYASLYRRYAKLNKLAGLAKQEYMIIGAGILAVFFGYYNFSRGYLPQSVKGFIFVVMPYYYLIARHYKRMRVSGSTDPRIRF
ncbi:MAG: hypothetical protein ACRD5H_10525, partial [Nitrososphaerales archaeon]